MISDTFDFEVSGKRRNILAAYSVRLLPAYWLILCPVNVLNQDLRLLSDIPDNRTSALSDVASLKFLSLTPSKAAASSILRMTAFSFRSISIGIYIIDGV